MYVQAVPTGNDSAYYNVSALVAANLTVSLAANAIPVTVLRDAAGRTYTSSLSSVDSCLLKKADGTVVTTRKANDALVLLDPGQVTAGERLTLTAQNNGPNGQESFPRAVETAAFRFGQPCTLTLTERGRLQVVWTRTALYPFAVLLYNGAGKLLWQNRSATNNVSDSSGSFDSPYLAPDSYTVVLVNRSFFDTLEPVTYDTLDKAKKLEHSTFVMKAVEHYRAFLQKQKNRER